MKSFRVAGSWEPGVPAAAETDGGAANVGPGDRLRIQVQQPENLVRPDRSVRSGSHDQSDGPAVGFEAFDESPGVQVLVAGRPMADHRRLGSCKQPLDPLLQVGHVFGQARDVLDRGGVRLVARTHQVQGGHLDVGRNFATQGLEDGIGIDPVGEFELQEFGL